MDEDSKRGNETPPVKESSDLSVNERQCQQDRGLYEKLLKEKRSFHLEKDVS